MSHVIYSKYTKKELLDLYRDLCLGRKVRTGKDLQGIREEVARRERGIPVPRRGLTQKQENFCYAFIACGNGAQALREVGYAPSTKLNDLLESEAVQAKLAEMRSKIMEKTKWDAEKVLDKFEKIYEEAMENQDLGNANRSMEFVGKHLGMHVERSETRVTQVKEPEELKKDIDKLADVAGLKVITGGKP
jgi:hypothetical protein